MDDYINPEPETVPGKKRPTSLTVMGVLGIVFSSMSLLGALSSCGMAACLGTFIKNIFEKLPQAAADSLALNTAQLMQSVNEFIQVMSIFLVAAGVLAVAQGSLGLIGSIGLVTEKRWSKSLCTAYAIIQIVGSVASAIGSALVINPALQNYMEEIQSFAGSEYAANPLSGMYSGVFQLFTSTVGAILGCIFPVLLLILLNTATAKDHFQKLQNPNPAT
jgi:hypothetical protein